MLPQVCISDKPMKWKSIASEMVFLLKYRKMPKFRGAYLFCIGAYIRRGLCTEENWRLKIDWASLILGRKFTVFLCFKKIIIIIRTFLRGWVSGWTGGEGFNEKPKKRIHILTGPGSGAGL